MKSRGELARLIGDDSVEVLDALEQLQKHSFQLGKLGAEKLPGSLVDLMHILQDAADIPYDLSRSLYATAFAEGCEQVVKM